MGGILLLLCQWSKRPIFRFEVSENYFLPFINLFPIPYLRNDITDVYQWPLTDEQRIRNDAIYGMDYHVDNLVSATPLFTNGMFWFPSLRIYIISGKHRANESTDNPN